MFSNTAMGGPRYIWYKVTRNTSVLDNSSWFSVVFLVDSNIEKSHTDSRYCISISGTSQLSKFWNSDAGAGWQEAVVSFCPQRKA